MTDQTEFARTAENPSPQLVKVSETRVRHERMGKGHLKIYTRYVAGVQVEEAFTFQSLADVLGLPMGTLEGRYNRGRLYHWKVDIPTGESRPVRGFALPLLGEVIRVVETPGSRVQAEGNEEFVVGRGGRRGTVRTPLAIETIAGKRYITVPALAEHFGMSITTIRNKLQASGLSAVAQEIPSSTQRGGRPRKVYPASMEEQLREAIDHGATFLSELDAVLAKARSVQPPPFDAQAAFARLRPAKPRLELVKPADDGMDGILANVNAIMAQAPAGKPGVVGAAVPLEDARHLTPSPQDGDAPDQWAQVRESALAMMRMEGFSMESQAEACEQLAIAGAPDSVIEQVKALAQAEQQRSAGGAA